MLASKETAVLLLRAERCRIRLLEVDNPAEDILALWQARAVLAAVLSVAEPCFVFTWFGSN